MMNARDSKPVVLLCFLTFAFILFADAYNTRRLSSKDSNLELDQKLKLINKPAIKSFKTEHSDIVDCVDIHKQLAFDHPLLKNHKIQMKPSFIPKRLRRNTSAKGKHCELLSKNIRCPEGTVAVKRATKEDFLMAKHFSSLRTNRIQNKYSPNRYYSDARYARNTFVEYRGKHYGVRGDLNVWSPSVGPDQFSTALIMISNAPTILQAGWGVYPYLYSNYSRLFTFWTPDAYESGCFNLLCPGFIQISSEVPLGLILSPISEYGDPHKQFYITVSLHQDPKTLVWWLLYRGKSIGYWPSTILPSLNVSAAYSAWGGIAYSPFGEKSPAMGNGHFPAKAFDYPNSAYISNMEVMDESYTYVHPNMHTFNVEEPQCYDLKYAKLPQPWGDTIFYGGPGQCVS